MAPTRVSTKDWRRPRYKMKLSAGKSLAQIALVALSLDSSSRHSRGSSARHSKCRINSNLADAILFRAPATSTATGRISESNRWVSRMVKLHVQLQEGPRADEIVRGQSNPICTTTCIFHVANYPDAFEWFPFHDLSEHADHLRISVIGTLLSCSLVAYGLACVEWRGRERCSGSCSAR